MVIEGKIGSQLSNRNNTLVIFSKCMDLSLRFHSDSDSDTGFHVVIENQVVTF